LRRYSIPTTNWPLPATSQVRLEFIEPGKPIQNAFIESFNSRLREECVWIRRSFEKHDWG
jgi:hypothetical protein